MAVARSGSVCSSTSSFEEALLYSLSALRLESTVSLKPEQQVAIQAVYAGSDVFVWLPMHGVWKEPLLPNSSLRDGPQVGSGRHAEEQCCAGCLSSGCIDGRPSAQCVDVSVSPDWPIIFYETKPRTDIDSDFLDLVTALRVNTTNTPRVLVYVTSLNTCADLYAHFHWELGSSSYYPEGAPEIPANRLFGMFHSHTPQRNKDLILRSLKEPGGVVRVVFCTVALGMGVDLKGVNSIVHYGAPRSLED